MRRSNATTDSAAIESGDVVRALPIGGRIAFDPAKGRLWLICDRCARWNLVPLEEHWEVTGECERLFRGTSLKVSGESITLAHVPAGLTLVRIGKANSFELAAWRYGQLLRRRRRDMALLVTTSSIVGVGIAVGWLQYGFLNAALPQAGAYLNATTPERPRSPGKALPAVSAMSRPEKLALEMAANEDIERRALAGELALLEAEIAAIADDLLLPDFVRSRLRRSA